MKRFALLALAAVLALVSLSFAAGAEGGPKFVTVREWLDAKGECGECMLLLKIREVLNPVLAVCADETGTVNLYSGGEDSIIVEFGNEDRMLTGYWIVIADPVYNVYEGTVEMARWSLLRMIPGLE